MHLALAIALCDSLSQIIRQPEYQQYTAQLISAFGATSLASPATA
jgi:hypothetical protein